MSRADRRYNRRERDVRDWPDKAHENSHSTLTEHAKKRLAELAGAGRWTWLSTAKPEPPTSTRCMLCASRRARFAQRKPRGRTFGLTETSWTKRAAAGRARPG